MLRLRYTTLHCCPLRACRDSKQLTKVDTIDTVVAAMENCVNIRPNLLMPYM